MQPSFAIDLLRSTAVYETLTIERMQPLKIAALPVLAHCHGVDRAVETSMGVNHGGGCDSDLWRDLAAVAIV